MEIKELESLINDLKTAYKAETDKEIKTKLKDVIEYVTPRAKWFLSHEKNITSWRDINSKIDSVNQKELISKDISEHLNKYLSDLDWSNKLLSQTKTNVNDKRLLKDIEQKMYLNSLYIDNLWKYAWYNKDVNEEVKQQTTSTWPSWTTTKEKTTWQQVQEKLKEEPKQEVKQVEKKQPVQDVKLETSKLQWWLKPADLVASLWGNWNRDRDNLYMLAEKKLGKSLPWEPKSAERNIALANYLVNNKDLIEEAKKELY